MNASDPVSRTMPSLASHAATPLHWDGRHGSQVVALFDRLESLFRDPQLSANSASAMSLGSSGDELARLRALCVHDLETGAYNRRHFEAMAESEWVRALRHRHALSVLIVEPAQTTSAEDFLPAMVRIAARAQMSLRAGGDLLARYDRTRFAILLPETDGDGARLMAERLCRAMGGDGQPALSQALRIGAATLNDSCAGEKGWRGALDVAEQALHRARQSREAVVSIEVAAPSSHAG